MPILIERERAIIDGALDLFWRMYEDEWENNHTEDCVRAALTLVVQEMRNAHSD